MATSRAAIAAAIEAKLDTYFATTSGSVRPDFSQFIADTICDTIQEALASHTTFAVDTSALSAGGDPVTGTATATATTTIP